MASQPFEPLTPAEREVLVLVSRGYRNREIAGLTFRSVETVRTHVRHVLEKLGVESRGAAGRLYQAVSGLRDDERTLVFVAAGTEAAVQGHAATRSQHDATGRLKLVLTKLGQPSAQEAALLILAISPDPGDAGTMARR
jgi:DNA-binding CsgD family transcriptional regulator